MSDLPDPLTPADCTMGGNNWFPLAHRRLRKSKWWRRASDLARARNVMLWGEAYDATPAGSLPDDDDELAEAAGFGLDVDAFLVFKAEIMAPWTLCSDGRWYHPTVCEVVCDTWERQATRRRADAARKARSRAALSAVTRDNADVTAEIATQTNRTEQTGQTEEVDDPPSESHQLRADEDENENDWPGNGVEDWEAALAAVSDRRIDPAKSASLVLSRAFLVQWQRDGMSFRLDVEPAVQGICAKLPDPVQSWKLFDKQIRRINRDRRAPVDLGPPREARHDDKLARKNANHVRAVMGALGAAARHSDP